VLNENARDSRSDADRRSGDQRDSPLPALHHHLHQTQCITITATSQWERTKSSNPRLNGTMYQIARGGYFVSVCVALAVILISLIQKSVSQCVFRAGTNHFNPPSARTHTRIQSQQNPRLIINDRSKNKLGCCHRPRLFLFCFHLLIYTVRKHFAFTWRKKKKTTPFFWFNELIISELRDNFKQKKSVCSVWVTHNKIMSKSLVHKNRVKKMFFKKNISHNS